MSAKHPKAQPKAVNPDVILRELHQAWVTGRKSFVEVKLAVKSALLTWATFNREMAKRGGLRKALVKLGAKKPATKEGPQRAGRAA